MLATRTLNAYFLRRKQLMGQIEEEDVKQLKSRQSEGSEVNTVPTTRESFWDLASSIASHNTTEPLVGASVP